MISILNRAVFGRRSIVARESRRCWRAASCDADNFASFDVSSVLTVLAHSEPGSWETKWHSKSRSWSMVQVIGFT